VGEAQRQQLQRGRRLPGQRRRRRGAEEHRHPVRDAEGGRRRRLRRHAQAVDVDRDHGHEPGLEAGPPHGHRLLWHVRREQAEQGRDDAHGLFPRLRCGQRVHRPPGAARGWGADGVRLRRGRLVRHAREGVLPGGEHGDPAGLAGGPPLVLPEVLRARPVHGRVVLLHRLLPGPRRGQHGGALPRAVAVRGPVRADRRVHVHRHAPRRRPALLPQHAGGLRPSRRPTTTSSSSRAT